MNEDQVTSTATATAKKSAIRETTLGGFLHTECGYSRSDIAAGKVTLFPKSAPGVRGWVEVAHADTGEVMKFWFSASANHSLATIGKYGLKLRMQLLAPQEGSARTVEAWYTSEPGLAGEETTLAALLFGDTSEASNDLAPVL